MAGTGLAVGLWALHPCRVESVAWVTERRDVLAALWLALGLFAWLRGRARQLGLDAGPAAPALGLAVLCFALSALAKAWAMSVPGVLFGLEIALFGATQRPGGTRRALEHASLWLMLAVPVAVVAAWAQGSAGATADAAGLPLSQRLLLALAAPLRYLALTLWPGDLAPLHPLRPAMAHEPMTLLLGAAGLALAAWLLQQRRRHPAWLGAAIGMVAWLAPVLGLLQSGVQAIAERYLHLAHLPLSLLLAQGLALAIGRGVQPLPTGHWRPGPLTLPALVLASLALAPTLGRTFVWQAVWVQGEEALWSAALEAEPYGPHALSNRAALRMQRGDGEGARSDLEKALRQAPLHSNAWTLLAEVHRQAGDAPASMQALNEALRLAPEDVQARCNRGGLRASAGDATGALQDFDRAIASAGPAEGAARAECLLNRAVLRVRSGDRAAARDDVRAALSLLPKAHGARARAEGMSRRLAD